MAEDTWDSRAMPILEHLAAVENPSMAIVNIGELADMSGWSHKRLWTNSIACLLVGLGGTVHKMLTGGDPRPWFLERASLTEKGARAVGMWPPEQLYSALLALIEQQAARAGLRDANEVAASP